MILLKTEKATSKLFYVYYTGHGKVGTGNWCLKDGGMNQTENCLQSN